VSEANCHSFRKTTLVIIQWGRISSTLSYPDWVRVVREWSPLLAFEANLFKQVLQGIIQLFVLDRNLCAELYMVQVDAQPLLMMQQVWTVDQRGQISGIAEFLNASAKTLLSHLWVLLRKLCNSLLYLNFFWHHYTLFDFYNQRFAWEVDDSQDVPSSEELVNVILLDSKGIWTQ
jgi:hypothetical protein